MFLTCTAINIPMLAHLRQYLLCEVPSVLMTKSAWRILFNRLTFVYSKDIICSALVIYYFRYLRIFIIKKSFKLCINNFSLCFDRIFERRMGSRKFSSFLLGSCTTATMLEICVILLLKFFDVQSIYSNQLTPGL